MFESGKSLDLRNGKEEHKKRRKKVDGDEVKDGEERNRYAESRIKERLKVVRFKRGSLLDRHVDSMVSWTTISNPFLLVV